MSKSVFQQLVEQICAECEPSAFSTQQSTEAENADPSTRRGGLGMTSVEEEESCLEGAA
jgi:hypothetical protein